MSEDFGNIEADLEALIAALELAGTVADRARRDALRLAKHVRKDPPRSRKEWANRARLTDADGRDLGWLDMAKARRVDLGDATEANDRNVPEQRADDTGRDRQGPGELVEVAGQFFEVHAEAGKGAPEQVRPITVEQAQARIAEHRPDLSTRMSGEHDPRLEITRTRHAQASNEAARSGPAGTGAEARQHSGASWASVAWDEPAPTGGGAVGARRSAAEAFGAVPDSRDRPRGLEAESAPSSAELTAVGATRPAEANWSR